ncbi:MAG: hypothetical protein ABEI98_11275 [Halorhabdus sp.]
MVERTADERTETAIFGGITVTRTLQAQASGIVGEVTVESAGRVPLLVTIEDAVPDGVAVTEAAFQPGVEPDMGTVTTDGLSIRQVVEDDPVQSAFGLLTRSPVENLAWGPPTIEDVRVVMDGQADATASGAGPDAVTATPPERAIETDGTGSLLPAAAESTPFVDPSTILRPDGDEAPAEADTPDVTGSDLGAEDGPETPQPSEGQSSERPDSDRSSGIDPVPALEAPAEADGWQSGETPARSVQVRLDHLSARVEEFAAYASAMESLLDERGTGSEVFAEIDDRLDTLTESLVALQADVADERGQRDAAVQALRTDVTETEERLTGLERTVADTEASVAALEATVNPLEDRLADLEADLATTRDRVDQVRRTVEAVGDDVAAMREEIDGLRSEVDRLETFRRSLAEISQDGDV